MRGGLARGHRRHIRSRAAGLQREVRGCVPRSQSSCLGRVVAYMFDTRFFWLPGCRGGSSMRGVPFGRARASSKFGRNSRVAPLDSAPPRSDVVALIRIRLPATRCESGVPATPRQRPHAENGGRRHQPQAEHDARPRRPRRHSCYRSGRREQTCLPARAGGQGLRQVRDGRRRRLHQDAIGPIVQGWHRGQGEDPGTRRPGGD